MLNVRINSLLTLITDEKEDTMPEINLFGMSTDTKIKIKTPVKKKNKKKFSLKRKLTVI